MTKWIFLAEVESTENPELTINRSLLDFGVYDFAVSRVINKDKESDLHTSLDEDADPSTGWFVNWVGER